MKLKNLNWEVCRGTIFSDKKEAYQAEVAPHQFFGVDNHGYNIAVLYMDGSTHESLLISMDKIGTFGRETRLTKHLLYEEVRKKFPYNGIRHPVVIADNFNVIRNTVPNQFIKGWLGSLSEAELKKIQPTELELKLAEEEEKLALYLSQFDMAYAFGLY